MPSSSQKLQAFLHAVADPMRRKILAVLKEKASARKGLSASEIESMVKLAQPTVSHHMRVLVSAGLVESQRDGHWRVYWRDEKALAERVKELRADL